MINLLDVHAREAHGLHPHWVSFHQSVVTRAGVNYHRLEGFVPRAHRECPVQDCTFEIRADEHQAFVENWSMRTGRCGCCGGTGFQALRWVDDQMIERARCAGCLGSGRRAPADHPDALAA